MKRFTLLLSAMLLACATNLWAEEVACWTFTSSKYPANKTNFAPTSGEATGSTFYLNGTGSTWNTSKLCWAFTAVTDITITFKVNTPIPVGSKIALSLDSYYNKATNAPMKGFTLSCKENEQSISTLSNTDRKSVV